MGIRVMKPAEAFQAYKDALGDKSIDVVNDRMMYVDGATYRRTVQGKTLPDHPYLTDLKLCWTVRTRGGVRLMGIWEANPDIAKQWGYSVWDVMTGKAPHWHGFYPRRKSADCKICRGKRQ